MKETALGSDVACQITRVSVLLMRRQLLGRGYHSFRVIARADRLTRGVDTAPFSRASRAWRVSAANGGVGDICRKSGEGNRPEETSTL